jgi:hypothetical protein
MNGAQVRALKKVFEFLGERLNLAIGSWKRAHQRRDETSSETCPNIYFQ